MARHRFARFWASVLVIVGLGLVATGVLSAVVALALDVPWGSLTGQAVLERVLAATVLLVSGVLAGAPFIVVGEMMRIFLEQRALIARQTRLLARLARRASDAEERGEGDAPSPADRLLRPRR